MKSTIGRMLVVVYSFVCLAFLHGDGLAQAVFTEPGSPEGHERFEVVAVSADGSTMAGTAFGGPQGSQPFIWRDNIGFIGLYDLINDNSISSGYAVDISGDGSLVCGQVNRPAGVGVVESTPFVWTIPIDTSLWAYEEVGIVGDGHSLTSSVQGISRDGSTIVGTYLDTLPACPGSLYPDDVIAHGYRYVIGDSAIEPLGFLPDGDCTDLQYGGVFDMYVNAVSGDGSVVVGSGGRQIDNQFNSLSPVYEAFRWDGSMAGLDNITDEEHNSYAHGVSDDGATIIGFFTERNTSGVAIPHLVQWSGGSRIDLGYPFESPYVNVEYPPYIGITGDANVVWFGSLLYDAGGGWRSVTDEAAAYGSSFGSIEQQPAIVDMSYDGNVIVGVGWDGSQSVSWRLIKRPCPDFDTREHVSEWELPANGVFSDETAWLDDRLPDFLTYALVDYPGMFIISLDRSVAVGGLKHTAGDVTFDLNGHSLVLGNEFVCGPELVSGSDDSLQVAIAFENGRITVNGVADIIGGNLSSFSLDDTALMDVTGAMYVNGPPEHIVGIGDQSYLQVQQQLILGLDTDKRGELLVTGQGAQLSTASLIVGSQGSGKVTAESETLIQADSLYIGYDIGGSGDVVVRHGATVSTEWVTMSTLSDASAVLTIEDAASELLCGGLIVGLSDSARVSVVNGGFLGGIDTTWIAAGYIDGSSGDIVVSGEGSEIDALEIDIAVGGLGDLSVLDGARVAGGSEPLQRLAIGSDSGSAGSVLVSGNFARLVADTIVVGFDGVGVLQCDSDGYVQANNLSIGPLGNVLGDVLYLARFQFTPKGVRAQDSTGLAVERLTLNAGASLSVDSVFLGEGGTLAGSGDVALDLVNDGTISPGDSAGHLATFTVGGSYSQTVDGILEIELGDGASDVLDVAGSAALDGEITVSIAPGYTPQVGDRFAVISAGSVTGTFGGIQPPVGTDVVLTYLADTVYAQIESTTSVADQEGAGELPSDFVLAQNYPNPFNPSTEIEFALPQAGHVRVDVFNSLGRRVAVLVDQHLSAGHKVVTWDGTDINGRPVASGVYLYRLTTDGFNDSRKMVLLK
ncbi:T9SS type A sorting domain-containing protein [candidate division GN15 bacterium]|nr:T9SS type A sorting domain-containing protein [candidate division GN15 bacterium]